jgi:hypothetical protein
MKEKIEILMEKLRELEYIEDIQKNIKGMAKNAASLDDCEVELFMELSNKTEIEKNTSDIEVIDLNKEEGEPSLSEIFERINKYAEQAKENRKVHNDNYHYFEYSINQTMCLKILDIINQELEKEKGKLTKSIKSKVSLF